jgi:hypothetical protein
MNLPDYDDEPTLPSSKNPLFPLPLPPMNVVNVAEIQDANRIARLEREILNMLEKRVVEPQIPDGIQLVLFAAVTRLRRLKAEFANRKEASEGRVITEP